LVNEDDRVLRGRDKSEDEEDDEVESARGMVGTCEMEGAEAKVGNRLLTVLLR
jgi:hypothetical protein